MARAEELARGMGHAHVGTEHVLLALLEDERGIAGQVLTQEAKPESIRAASEAVLANPRYPVSTSHRFP